MIRGKSLHLVLWCSLLGVLPARSGVAQEASGAIRAEPVGRQPVDTALSGKQPLQIVHLTGGSMVVGTVEQQGTGKELVVKTAASVRRFGTHEVLRIEPLPTDSVACAQKLDRIIFLKSGGLVRGQLSSRIVGSQGVGMGRVSLILASGEMRQIPIEEISSEKVPGPASSRDAPNDVPGRVRVQLKTGQIIAGELVQWDPKERLVIRLATEEVRSFDVKEIAALDARLRQTPVVPTIIDKTRQMAREETGSVQVFLVAPEGITLQMENDAPEKRIIGWTPIMWDQFQFGPTEETIGSWLAVCQPPCGRVLPRDRRYRIRSTTLPKIDPFRIGGVEGSQLTLRYRLKTGKRGLRILGGFLIGVGIPSIVAGSTVAALSTSQGSDRNAYLGGGLTGLLSGVASVAVGGWLVGRNLDRVSLEQRAGVPDTPD